MKRRAGALSEKVEEKGAMCEECKEKPSKYKCPGCSIRTCSLPCVNAHKDRTNCSGKRNFTQLVTLSEYDDNTLLSGIHMYKVLPTAITESLSVSIFNF